MRNHFTGISDFGVYCTGEGLRLAVITVTDFFGAKGIPWCLHHVQPAQQ